RMSSLGRPAEGLQDPVGAQSRPSDSPVSGLVCASVFAIGWAALSHQVLMTRVAVLFFGNGIAVFPVVLAAFLLATGVSAWLASGRVFLPQERLPGAFCALLAAGGLSLALAPLVLGGYAAADLGWMGRAQDLVLLAAVFPPFCLLGALLPAAIRLLCAREEGFRAAGRIYALDSLGGLLGAATANTLFVPWLGVQGTLCAQAGMLLALALGLYWRMGISAARRQAALAGAAACWAALALLPARLERLYLTEISNGVPVRLLLHQEARAASITVVDFPTHREMFLDGIEEASTRPHHVRLFMLLGILPALLAEDEAPREGFMIAFGAGMSAGAALQSGAVSSLEVADVNGDVRAIAELFREHNGAGLDDPRIRFFAEDGRDFLSRSRKRYDVILADSTHPLAYDSWLLYTREFYRLVRARLAPEGVFALWVPLSQLPEDSFRVLVRTFLESFPNATLWNIPGSEQSLLLATPGPLSIDLGRVQERLDRIPKTLRLKEHQMEDAFQLAAYLNMGPEALRAFIGEETRLNTDDLPYGQRAIFRKSDGPMIRIDAEPKGPLSAMKGVPEARRAELERRMSLAAALRRYHVRSDPNALAEAFDLDPSDGIVLVHCRGQDPEFSLRASVGAAKDRLAAEAGMAREEDGVRAAGVLMSAGFLEEARRAFLSARRRTPGSIAAREGLARILQTRRAQDERMREKVLADSKARGLRHAALEDEARRSWIEGRFEESLTLLEESLEEYPGNTLARINSADLLRRLGRGEEARAQLLRVLEINPISRPALKRLGLEAQKHGRGASASADLPELYPCGEYCRPWEESWLREGSEGMSPP
ncbi:MAG: fused MFS/spermidine synthase, partial [Elusimicrobiota bacterium]